jgi:apolipoprotein N-acyltransferase
LHSSLQAAAPAKASAAPLKALAQGIVLASPWRRALIAFAAGAVSVLALAPTHIWPLLFFTFPVLVWLVDGISHHPTLPGKRGRVREAARAMWTAALIGWCFGFGYLLAGLYWVGHAFMVDAEIFGWLMPLAVVALPAAMALYIAAALALARLIWTRGATRILVLAAALTVAEWLRGHAFTGFPWNAIGYALTGPLELAQSAALTGIWGLTFIAVAVFASPATLADDRADTPRPWLPLVCALFVLSGMALYGTARLAGNPTSFVDGVRLRIMQPNLQQDAKFRYAARAEVMSRYVNISARATQARPHGLRDVTHLIWPESPFPFLLTREPEALAAIAALLPEGTVLITGADRADAPLSAGLPTGSGQRGGFYNSVYVIDHRGAVLALYDKLHLVPFGEFLPFQRALERLGLLQLTKVVGGFRAGERREPIAVLPAPPMLPLLCYEIIFPGEAVPPGERPGWLLNLTNDGWFGISTGPHQHFQQARVRAIEEGLPLVRAANTGISAIVDPLGRIVQELPLGTEGLLDGALPQRVAPTPYARLGDAVAALLVALAFAVVLRRRFRRMS